MKIKLVLLVAFVVVASFVFPSIGATHKLKLIVTPPQNYQPSESVHIVGNFNDWLLSGAKATQLQLVEGKLIADLAVTDDELFFTFVKEQDWQHMPASVEGKSLCTYYKKLDKNTTTLFSEIPAWKTDAILQEAQSSATENVRYLKDFYVPQYDRKADIAIYLPESYKTLKDKKYPVLYMLDGQNIFDAATSYSDEWKVDELLSNLEHSDNFTEIIVVAIPNGFDRSIEYNPWNFVNGDGEVVQGKGAITIDFIKNTLKPHVDKHFRTEPENSGLAGSSLGGLMALYAAIEHSDVFKFVASFSPALDIKDATGSNVLFEAIKNKKLTTSKIYFDIGKIEYGDYSRIETLFSMLQVAYSGNVSHLRLVKDDQGRHCELDWSKRFPDAIKWLLTEESEKKTFNNQIQQTADATAG